MKVGAEVGAYKETKTKWPKEKSGSEIQGEKARMYFGFINIAILKMIANS